MLHPGYEMQTLGESRRTEAENLELWSEASALRKEMSRLREHYRRLQIGDDPCLGQQVTGEEMQHGLKLFRFLSGLERKESEFYDAIVVLSNWYDRSSKIRKVLELAAKHRNAWILLVGGRGRLSSSKLLNWMARRTLRWRSSWCKWRSLANWAPSSPIEWWPSVATSAPPWSSARSAAAWATLASTPIDSSTGLLKSCLQRRRGRSPWWRNPT